MTAEPPRILSTGPVHSMWSLRAGCNDSLGNRIVERVVEIESNHSIIRRLNTDVDSAATLTKFI